MQEAISNDDLYNLLDKPNSVVSIDSFTFENDIRLHSRTDTVIYNASNIDDVN